MLVNRARRKDIGAMRTLYERYAKEMLATSYRITNDLQGSEDILQEAFLDAFEKIGQLKDGNRFAVWLKRIMINKSLASIKRRVYFEEVDSVMDLPEDEVVVPLGYSFADLQSMIQELPEGCRQVFSLYLLDDYKHKEIAELLDISVSTSKSQYRYAIKLLRDKLSQAKQ